MKRKLGINTATGIIGIAMGIFTFIGSFAFWQECIKVIEENPYGLNQSQIAENLPMTMVLIYTMGWFLTIVPLIFSIISIVKSKKARISSAGPITLLVASILNGLSINVFGIILGIVMIIGGAIGLLQKNLEDFDMQTLGQVNSNEAPMQSQVKVGQVDTSNAATTATTVNLNKDNNQYGDDWNL